jgi:hypothetical protein
MQGDDELKARVKAEAAAAILAAEP